MFSSSEENKAECSPMTSPVRKLSTEGVLVGFPSSIAALRDRAEPLGASFLCV